jgi:phosphopantetheine adenylyltransferase
MSMHVLHHGHINIINEAAKCGLLTIGLLTDEIIAKHKRVSMLKFHVRKKILKVQLRLFHES